MRKFILALAAALAVVLCSIAVPVLAQDAPAADTAKRAVRKGDVRVRNASHYWIEVWITRDDPDVPWARVGYVRPYRAKTWRVPRTRVGDTPYGLAAVFLGGDPRTAQWGPTAPFALARRFVWTLTE